MHFRCGCCAAGLGQPMPRERKMHHARCRTNDPCAIEIRVCVCVCVSLCGVEGWSCSTGNRHVNLLLQVYKGSIGQTRVTRLVPNCCDCNKLSAAALNAGGPRPEASCISPYATKYNSNSVSQQRFCFSNTAPWQRGEPGAGCGMMQHQAGSARRRSCSC